MEIAKRYAALVMSRNSIEWCTTMFPKDGIFETSGGVFVGHKEIIEAANRLFSMCVALEYNVSKVYCIDEDHFIADGTVQYTVKNKADILEQLQPITISADFQLVPFSDLIQRYTGNINKTSLFAANGLNADYLQSSSTSKDL
mmetsp:Transcript_8210/g.12247  ORF Transcript_8210/g.12247 Transcript_8210/m.12247 type:complete len:143 (-) Transcript_8210:328-756(-)